MKTYFKPVLAFAFAASFLTACDGDDDGPEPTPPVIENEEEVITTLNYTLTPSGGGDAIVLQFRDADGDGANPAIITVDSLDANTSYNGSISLLNETETPAEDITLEIAEEDEEHQFFFQVNSGNFSVNYNDMDSSMNPIGLATILTTQDTSGTLTVILRHEPNKTATGVSGGDITNAGGETDIEVTFPINVR